MKTKTEKELEREIDRLTGGYVPSTAKKMRKKIFEALEKIRQETKKEFNKKVEELKKKKFCYKDHDCRIFECEYAIKVDDLDKIFSNHSPQNKNTQHHSFAE